MNKINQWIIYLVFSVVLIWSNDALAQKTLIKQEGMIFVAPEVSPDGKFIALTLKGYRGLWVVRSDGYDLRQLSEIRGAGYIKRWSPDSKWLLFRETFRENNKTKQLLKVAEVYSKNVSGISAPVNKFEDVRWFSDDKLYLRSEGKALYIKSGLYVETKKSINQTAVHTDSKKIILENMNKAELRALTPVLGASYLNPILSPDGKKIVFKVIGGNLQVYELDNFQLHDLGAGERPNWSPDNERIIYQISTDDGHTITSSDIYIIKFDGTKKTAVTLTKNVYEMRPSFFPGGKKIIYDTDLLGEIRTIKVPSK